MLSELQPHIPAHTHTGFFSVSSKLSDICSDSCEVDLKRSLPDEREEGEEGRGV